MMFSGTCLINSSLYIWRYPHFLGVIGGARGACQQGPPATPWQSSLHEAWEMWVSCYPGSVSRVHHHSLATWRWNLRRLKLSSTGLFPPQLRRFNVSSASQTFIGGSLRTSALWCPPWLLWPREEESRFTGVRKQRGPSRSSSATSLVLPFSRSPTQKDLLWWRWTPRRWA